MRRCVQNFWPVVYILQAHLIIQGISQHSKLLTSHRSQESADLVFLIDGSENIGAANFPRARDLALRVIEGLDLGRDAIRVAVVLYSDAPEITHYLSSDKRSVLNAVKVLGFPGGDEANLGAALVEVVQSTLSSNAGGRAEEGVNQILVVISAGQSTDDFSEGERSVREANIYTFGVAIGDEAAASLEAVVSDSSFVLKTPDLTNVASMRDQLLPYVRGVIQGTITLQREISEGMYISHA
uniref:VWFA domain-containing protein n=2 Tax=Denticeps clupeoides TaxID=299321 RepID=A0AAY4BZE8_9TELE